ncbi:phage integrase SAM-like domain-containing protein [Runella zeae]|uniref:phage integrase SAM-like domain-containing protein n=1 Tax=Runella zeae TaxID=94255 RepID=UPI002354F845|nr:phage integrase SAM-like domain-containing protein [Runella zeae]
MFNFKKMFVLFWFRKSDSKAEKLKREENPNYDTLGGLCCRITIATQVEEIGSVHINIKRSAWDEKTQRVIGNDSNARRYNRTLNDIKNKLERIYELLQIEHGDEVTPKMVKDLFTGKKFFRYTFEQLIEEYFKDRKEEKEAGLVSQETLDVHQNYSKNFKEYLVLKGLKTLAPSHFEEDHLDGFKIFLMSKPKSFVYGHTRKHLSWVKQLLKHSLRKKRIKSNPLEGVIVKSEPDDPDTTHLSISQLERVVAFDFMKLYAQGYIAQETAIRLDRERDAFVFSAFTGMHHCDYTKRKYWLETYKGATFLKGKRKKTQKVFSLKLLEPAVAILQKYGGQIENLPVKSNQKRNTTLKELATMCKVPLVLSTKIARKTFANMALNVLMLDEGDVAACLGLTTTRSLKHYVKIKEERIARKMTSWNDVLRIDAA